jgi:hypothetical protein
MEDASSRSRTKTISDQPITDLPDDEHHRKLRKLQKHDNTGSIDVLTVAHG